MSGLIRLLPLLFAAIGIGGGALAAVATAFTQDAVLNLARREGWPAKYRRRGGVFGVIEMWIEGRQIIEVLTPQMQAEYLSAVTIPNWKQMLAAGRP